MRRNIVAACAALLIVLFMLASSGISDAPETSTAQFSMDWRAQLVLTSEGVAIEFTPEVNSDYDIALFCAEGSCVFSSVVYLDDEVISEGTDKISVYMSEGECYRLVVKGTGECTVEVMRYSKGRSISMPTDLVDGNSSSLIAREGNAGWFRFVGEAGLATICVLPGVDVGLNLEALVYDRDGLLVASSIPLEGGACAVYFEPTAETTYYLRVASPTGGKGMYTLSLSMQDPPAPESVKFLTGDLDMRVGEMRAARARVQPSGAADGLLWFSSDAAVVEVTDKGYMTAVDEGSAVVTAYGYGGISHSINITVTAVTPENIVYQDGSLTVYLGDVVTPVLTVNPSAAASADFEYSSSDPAVVSVSDTGEITALSVGTAEITARYGELTARLEVVVNPALPRHRVLLIGEQLYGQDVNTVRTGSVNTVYNLESLFATANYSGEGDCEVRVELDLTRDEALLAIEQTFSDASADDVSVLYITCHGYYRDGMSILQFVDGSELAALDLELALRRIEGTVVLIIDCCDSGGFIASYEELTQFTGGVMTAFAGGEAPFKGSKYKVLVSAALRQDSYRLGYGDGEGDAATVFARALCDALGWDIDAGDRGALNADVDYDGMITLWETYLYTRSRVHWYMDMADNGTGECMQDVQVYPEGDMFILFER